jgi:hypothetical protein
MVHDLKMFESKIKVSDSRLLKKFQENAFPNTYLTDLV